MTTAVTLPAPQGAGENGAASASLRSMVGSGIEGIFAVEFMAVESRSLRGLFVESIPGTPEGIKEAARGGGGSVG